MYKHPIMHSIYIQQLVIELKTHDTILKNEVLAKKTWSKSTFKECSKVIGSSLASTFSVDDMMSYGTSISYKTLETICKFRYELKSPLDRRRFITLTKLARFIGYESWTAFTQSVDSRSRQYSRIPQQNQISTQLVMTA